MMTLDAGGTTLKFSAIRADELLVGPIEIPSEADHLERCLGNLVRGFETVKQSLPDAPVAISFAFPGPADYPAGIVANIGNLPAFRGGVPLGPILEASSASRFSSTMTATCSSTARPSPAFFPM